jgi:hypothetical protein
VLFQAGKVIEPRLVLSLGYLGVNHLQPEILEIIPECLTCETLDVLEYKGVRFDLS